MEQQLQDRGAAGGSHSYLRNSLSSGGMMSRVGGPGMFVPKVVEPDQTPHHQNINNNNGGSPGSHYTGIGIGGRRYGGWANVVRNRAALAAAANSQQQQQPQICDMSSSNQLATPNAGRRAPPCSMEIGANSAMSAPPSYNQCKQS